MQKKYEEIMQEVDARMVAIDLNGKQIIADCKEMICFFKGKLTEIKVFLSSHPFDNEIDEVTFFKYQKPTLTGRLIYFHKILRIESQRPVAEEELDVYYQRKQEELKRFFDRHLAFFQYYRSGSTHMDKYYFLRGREEYAIDVDVCHFDDDSEFSTGYDHLVARIIAMEMLYAFLSFRRNCLQSGREGAEIELLKVKGSFQWTGTVIELAELIYALDEVKRINNGNVPINELASFIGTLFGMDIRDCYGAYSDMKKRKDGSRTYLLDEMQQKLNKRMELDDDKVRRRR